MVSPAKRMKNPIEEHAQLNEAILKEQKHFSINESYTLNPRSLVQVSDKPNRVRPEDFSQLPEDRETEKQL
jgi:hypothetical protein